MKKGNCYDSNGRHFMDKHENDWKLVHGEVMGKDL